MTVIIVRRVTPALRGTISRWLLEVDAGVFVGSVSSAVRDRLWHMVQGRKRLGACTLITRTPNEQGFTIHTAGESRRSVVDYDGLALIRVAHKRLPDRSRSVTPENPSGEASGGDPPVRGPVEGGKFGGDAEHPERTVLPE